MAMKKQPKPQANLTRQMSQPKPAGSYSTDAHTDRHHIPKKDGQAFGKVNDSAPMDYTRRTQAEGNQNNPVANVPSNSMSMAKKGHLVGAAIHPARNAHNIGGHAAHVRSGVLRNSGVAGAHRVGKR